MAGQYPIQEVSADRKKRRMNVDMNFTDNTFSMGMPNTMPMVNQVSIHQGVPMPYQYDLHNSTDPHQIYEQHHSHVFYPESELYFSNRFPN